MENSLLKVKYTIYDMSRIMFIACCMISICPPHLHVCVGGMYKVCLFKKIVVLV